MAWRFESEFRSSVDRLTRGKSPKELEDAAEELEGMDSLLSELADDLRMKAADMEEQNDDPDDEGECEDPEPDEDDS